MEAAAGQLRLDQVFPLPFGNGVRNSDDSQTNILSSLRQIYISGRFDQRQHAGGAPAGGVPASTAVPHQPDDLLLNRDVATLLQATHRQLSASSGRDWPRQSAPTSSVSYVVASESSQEGTNGRYEPLPHVTIRPPGLLDTRGPEADQLADVMLRQVLPYNVLPYSVIQPYKKTLHSP
ncbi:hypothetical protein PLESTM_002032000 [Pleodorina starrii]|nr:hypothetical protein PLESTM_002032000 [Pleodorina starrii]